MNKRTRKIFTTVLAVLLMLSGLVFSEVKASENYASEITLTFSDDGITETVAGSGYSIDGTVLNISSAGVYVVTGSCNEGSIVIAKGASDIVLVLDGLTLKCSQSAPLVVKKGAAATVHIESDSYLYDDEDPADETSEDTAVADAFEGAAIKVKSGSSLTFCGEGKLHVYGNAKNGIKGGSEAVLSFLGGSYEVHSANNGIASDGSLIIYGGSYVIEAENDGIKSVPEADDTASEGKVVIYNGSFDIDVNGDGIQGDASLTIYDGSFDIKTLDGYKSSSFDKDTMSCKGLKASGDRELENEINISGGTYSLNTADDAVHSDYYVTITGGTFDIYTGDDGVHADTMATFGYEDGYQRDPDIRVSSSYEGLEAGNVHFYSGRYYVVASDDGINAAGNTTEEFKPGPWGGGSSSDYNLHFHGGEIFVNCTGDGLDANGNLNMYGGKITVLAQGTGGDNSPFDADGSSVINGATVFGAGTNPMNENPVVSSGKYVRSSSRYSANSIIRVSLLNETLFNVRLPRNINYLLYVNPDISSNPSLTTASSVDGCHSTSWTHNWDDGETVKKATETSDGLKVFSCRDCGAQEYQTVKYVRDCNCEGHVSEHVIDEGFPVVFEYDEGVAGIDVYYTQDYSSPDETDVTSGVSRNSLTGEPDSTGSGQVNFLIRLNDGYSISEISATEGAYKNIKADPEGDGSTDIYRITKITGDLTVTIKTSSLEYDVCRVYGNNRYETSLAAADKLKELLGTDKFSSAVITTGNNYADALSGSYLANINNAPMLLIRSNSNKSAYADKVVEYVRENVASGGIVYILGGEAAVEDEWINDLKDDYDLVRLSGDDRYLTNLEILKTAGFEGGQLLVCTGRDYADSLSAAAVDLPLLLVNGTRKLTEDQKNYLSECQNIDFIILGGSAAVSEDIAAELENYGQVKVRIDGEDRYDTSVKIAETFFAGSDHAVLTYGRNYPDGLSGGVLAHALHCPLLLVSSTATGSQRATAFCADNSIINGIVLGGNSLITDEYVRKVFALAADYIIK